MLWTFGEVREGRGDEETMMRGNDKKKRNNVPLFFCGPDETHLSVITHIVQPFVFI